MIKILNFNIYPTILKSDKKIMAYSLHFSPEKSLRHLEKIKSFHNLDGEITTEKKYQEKILEQIQRFLSGKKIRINTEVYRNGLVYEELLKIKRGETTTYSELAKKTGLKIYELIRTLAHNPMLILIPCHRIIRKDGNISGYTPLGKEFKMALLKKEGFLRRG